MKISQTKMDSVKFGVETDIGGSNKNQDHWFNWKDDEKHLCVFGIADGHGTYGEVVSQLTTKTILEYIDTNAADLETDVLGFLHRCFTLSNESFQRLSSDDSTTTAGGTTLSIVAIVRDKLYVANVGDSPVYLCTKSAVLKRSMIRHEIDFSVPPDMQLLHDDDDDDELDVTESLCSTIELTCSHSPDSLREFDRIRKQHPSTESPGYPELSFLYDKRGSRKDSLKPIFTVASSPVKDHVGDYYKNVSKEWASIVKGGLPGHLAFTRSIGDFYWKGYGVTEHPEIQSFDLKEISSEDVICVVAVSDGVSDNWVSANIGKFVMDPSCLNAVATQADIGAKRVALSLIRRNAIYATRHFGTDTDNATANIAYITPLKISSASLQQS